MDHSSYKNIHGKQYLRWTRCSTLGQADTSIDDQVAIIEQFAQTLEMKFTGDVILDGISGLSARKIDAAVQDIITRKHDRNDFDVILIHDLSRLTRMGVLNGAGIERDFQAAGIRLISVTDGIPDDSEFSEVMKSFKHFASNKLSRDLAYSTTRGSMSALKRGDRPHAQTAPYGTDKLVHGQNKQPRFILHLLPNGDQQKLSYPSRDLVETYGRQPSGASAHYRLQPGEGFSLIPGDPRHVDIVNLIYEWFHLEGIGSHAIAKRLNDRAVLSAHGKKWSPRTVDKILTNEVYLGVGVSNRETTGRYFMRSKQGPKPTNRSHEELNQYTQPPRILRNEDEWEWVQAPALKDFIRSKEVQPLARQYQKEYWQRKAENALPKQPRNGRHHQSKFILSNRLICMKSGLPLRGFSSGKKRAYRYYGIGKVRSNPSSNSDLSMGLLPARPIEAVVISELRRLILLSPNLKDKIKKIISQKLESNRSSIIDVKQLQSKLQQIDNQMSLLVDLMPSMGRETANRKANELRENRYQIESQISQVDSNSNMTDHEINQLTAQLVERIGSSDSWVRTAGLRAISRLLDLLLAKVEVNLETRLVKIEFCLPEWVILNPKGLCLAPTHHSTCRREADSNGGILLCRSVFLIGAGSAVGYSRIA